MKPKKDLFFIGLGLMIILQIYNNDWLEIVVYTERTGTIEIEFVAKNWIIFSNFFFSNFFFSSYFLSFVFWVFFESDGKIEINNKKNWAGNFFFLKNLKLFFILVRCFFFLVTTFKFGLFSSFFYRQRSKNNKFHS